MPLPHVDDLLAPISPDEPCGPNLEYTKSFWELSAELAGRPERQFGTFIEPAQAPDWARVQELAAQLFSETKDLRIAIAWARAATAIHGLEGAAFGLQLIAGLLTRWPRDVHPVVEPDDERPAMRWWILAGLGAPGGFLHELRRSTRGLDTASAAIRTRLNQALNTIRQELLDTAAGEPLPELWHAAAAVEGADGGTDARMPSTGPSGDPLVWSPDHQELLETMCHFIDGTSIDAAAACRRAERIGFDQFLDLAASVAPAHREHAAAFLQPPGSTAGGGSDGREQS